MRIERAAEVPEPLGDPRDLLITTDDSARDDIRVPVEVFRGAVDAEIEAERERLEVHRRVGLLIGSTHSARVFGRTCIASSVAELSPSTKVTSTPKSASSSRITANVPP